MTRELIALEEFRLLQALVDIATWPDEVPAPGEAALVYATIVGAMRRKALGALVGYKDGAIAEHLRGANERFL